MSIPYFPILPFSHISWQLHYLQMAAARTTSPRFVVRSVFAPPRLFCEMPPKISGAKLERKAGVIGAFSAGPVQSGQCGAPITVPKKKGGYKMEGNRGGTRQKKMMNALCFVPLTVNAIYLRSGTSEAFCSFDQPYGATGAELARSYMTFSHPMAFFIF